MISVCESGTARNCAATPTASSLAYWPATSHSAPNTSEKRNGPATMRTIAPIKASEARRFDVRMNSADMSPPSRLRAAAVGDVDLRHGRTYDRDRQRQCPLRQAQPSDDVGRVGSRNDQEWYLGPPCVEECGNDQTSAGMTVSIQDPCGTSRPPLGWTAQARTPQHDTHPHSVARGKPNEQTSGAQADKRARTCVPAVSIARSVCRSPMIPNLPWRTAHWFSTINAAAAPPTGGASQSQVCSVGVFTLPGHAKKAPSTPTAIDRTTAERVICLASLSFATTGITISSRPAATTAMMLTIAVNAVDNPKSDGL